MVVSLCQPFDELATRPCFNPMVAGIGSSIPKIMVKREVLRTEYRFVFFYQTSAKNQEQRHVNVFAIVTLYLESSCSL